MEFAPVHANLSSIRAQHLLGRTKHMFEGVLTVTTAVSLDAMLNPYSQAIPQERHRRSLNLVQVHVGRDCPCNPRERLLVRRTNDVYSTSWAEVSTEQPTALWPDPCSGHQILQGEL
jgi:hypothetical protein